MRGTQLPETTEVTCNWCGKKVLAYLARYISGVGSFYHPDCFEERKNA